MKTDTLRLSSPVFAAGGLIPSLYSCDGENINPPLIIEGVPDVAVSLVLIMDDPDVPKDRRPDDMFDHWVVWNIPPTTREIVKNIQPAGVVGRGTSGKLRYTGPCPPDREHRYFFKLYALDTRLDLPEGSTKAEVERAFGGHVIAQTELMGRYDRPRL